MLAALVVKPGTPADLAERDPRYALGLDKAEGKRRLEDVRLRLIDLQAKLYAEGRRSVLLILQGLDAAGKDGAIRTVFQGVNPQGCRVVSFKAPTSTELAHDYLWRVHAHVPARGEIGIFNRSHYEDVVAVRMHDLAPEEVWRRRPAHIVEWERMLVDEGTTIVKAFLHVSQAEQRKRFRERLDDPAKRWKFRPDDLKVADRYGDYLRAWEDVIAQTSTEYAPWAVVPADRNWVKALVVATLLVEALEAIDPAFPQPEAGIDQLERA